MAAYWQFGTGPLTRGNQHQPRQWVHTAKGWVNWAANDASLYSAIKSAVGEDGAPLFALAQQTGGFDYYLDRANPSPSAQGLMFAGVAPSQLIDLIRASRPILLKRQVPFRVRVPSGSSITSWKILVSPNYVEMVERPLFQKISAGCERSTINSEPPYWIYRCR